MAGPLRCARQNNAAAAADRRTKAESRRGDATEGLAADTNAQRQNRADEANGPLGSIFESMIRGSANV